MAIVSMTDAVFGNVASSAEYNKVTANIRDLDARLGAVVSGSSAQVRLAALEALTTNTSGAVGIGNQRLSDRLGAGVTNASTAAAQLSALQTTVNNAAALGSGNNAMNTRIVALEAAAGSARPYLHAYQSVVQTLTTTATTEIIMQSEIIDNTNRHNVANGRFMPNVAGYYRCFGIVAFDVSVTGDRVARFRKNGADVTGGAPYSSMPAMNGTGFSGGFAIAGATIQCNGSTDYISLWGAHNHGSNLNTNVGSNAASYMIIEWVAP